MNHLFQDSVDPVALAARLDSDTIDSPRLRAQLNLPPGTYAVIAHIWKECADHNRSRAHLRFMWRSAADGGKERIIGEVLPCAVSGESKWSWFHVGAVQSAGPCTLVVTAHNARRLPEAYADLGRVVFVPATGFDAAAGYRPEARLALPASPTGSYSVFTIQLPVTYGGQQRSDLIFTGPDGREPRQIALYSLGTPQ